MRRVRWVVLLVILVEAGVAAAQEARRLDPVVVTATKIETPAEQLGASVTVVTGEEIQKFHYQTVGEALRRVPGVEVQQQGSLGKLTGAKIRGANANQVQVLIDGVRVKSPTTGQVDLSDISPDLIDRIEIIRGPQSTLYGADAIGGVINIITKKGKGPFSASAEQEVGNYDTLRSKVGASGAFKIFDYSFSASHGESNGQFRNDGSEANAINGRVGVSLPWNTSLAYILRYNRSDTDLGVRSVSPRQPIQPLIDVNAKQQSETTVMALEAQTRPVDWWESRARVARYENNLGFQDPPDPGTADVGSFSQIDVERREVEWANHLHLGKWSTSSVGIEYRHEQGENKNTFHTRTHTSSYFFQEQLRFFDRLFMSAGFRTEDHSVFGKKTTERGSLAYLIKETGTRIHGSAGSGFRAPTLNDLFFPDASNISLKPETSFSYDAGVDQAFWKNRARLGLTFFRNAFENLIQFDLVKFIPENVARARSAGVEFTSEVDLLDNLMASVNYTFTDSEDLKSRHPLRRVAPHRWSGGLTWDPFPRLSLFTQVTTVSRQFESDRGHSNSGHTRVDVGGTYRLLARHGLLQSLDVFARVQNLLNEGYAEVRGFPALGINTLVGLRAAF